MISRMYSLVPWKADRINTGPLMLRFKRPSAFLWSWSPSRVKCERPREKVGGAICCHFKQLLFRWDTHTHTHTPEASSLQMARLHQTWRVCKETQQHNSETHTLIYSDTFFIRMNFVTAAKRLLHFHVPSDRIFTALHYFASIKCGRWKQSNGCFCSLLKQVCKTVTQTHTHKHLKVF